MLKLKVGRGFTHKKSHEKTYPENFSIRLLAFKLHYIKNYELCLNYFHAKPPQT